MQKLGLSIENNDLKVNEGLENSTQEVAQKWFQNLNRRQVWRLFKLYQPDFELFDYYLEPYYSLAKP